MPRPWPALHGRRPRTRLTGHMNGREPYGTSYNQIGWVAPVILIALRMLQGLALGGEYGGAAVYVAEHAPVGRRGFYTSWIQTTATVGLLLSLLVILVLRLWMGEAGFQRGEGYPIAGWGIPFLLSVVLLGILVWIRL